MRVVVSSLLRAHTIHLARQLHRRKVLVHLFSSYPRWKLKEDGLPQALISTTPWFMVPYMALHQSGSMPHGFEPWLAYLCHRNHDNFTARHLLPCDIFHGLSCHNLRAGLKAQLQGAKYVCDHGSSHISWQDRILREEAELVGLSYQGVDPRVIEAELEEYSAADRVFVASKFA